MEKIEFRSDSTYLFLKSGEEKVVLTQVFYGDERGTSYELFVGQISDLSLDHKLPLVKLKPFLMASPELNKLSVAALAHLHDNPQIKKYELDRYFSGLDFSAGGTVEIHADRLSQELDVFLKQAKLVTMHRRYNSSKSGE